ncbi:hypothetical protein LAZ67_9003892 [Cordylochernes scorpioides]|uniref:dolichyl-phosphate-mannose--protein mannosyltransferase n=1 Tax=Cordylochernes scorpioides TaxID=51811 RepID=A0ABY6KVD6_9ARAC|nr:hypothetical protein LAZ67_9003892 [Cordylochernes scorpioides]
MFAPTLMAGGCSIPSSLRAILSNPDLLPSTPISALFRNDFWGTPLSHSGSHKSYRPLCVLTFRLNYALGGLDPRGYHAANVALHGLVSALFTRLASRWAQRPLLAGLLFAAHPVHAEAVAGVVGRAELQACLFFLLALLAFRSGRLGMPAAVLATGAAMLSKEHGVTALAVCGVLDVFVYHGVALRDLPRVAYQKQYSGLRRALLHLGGAAALLIGLRLYLMGGRAPEFSPADNPAAACPCRLTRALTFLFLPAFNLWLLLCPAKLSFDWSMDAVPLVDSARDPRNLASLALYTGLAALLWASRRSRPALIFALALLVLPFLPASNLFFYVGFVVAERVLYIPSMGFCLLVAVGADKLAERASPLAYRAVAGVLLALLATRTYRRTLDWLSEERLYRAGVAVNPPKAYGNLANILSSNILCVWTAYGNLANILSSKGEKEEAEQAYRLALSYRSNMADVHYNLGILLQEQGRLEEALESYRMAVQYRPRLAMAHLNMGLVLSLLGDKSGAAEVYRRCADLDSSGLRDPRLHESTKISALFNLGRLLADDGKFQEAVAVYQEAVGRMPSHYQPQSLYNMLGESIYLLYHLHHLPAVPLTPSSCCTTYTIYLLYHLHHLPAVPLTPSTCCTTYTIYLLYHLHHLAAVPLTPSTCCTTYTIYLSYHLHHLPAVPLTPSTCRTTYTIYLLYHLHHLPAVPLTPSTCCTTYTIYLSAPGEAYFKLDRLEDAAQWYQAALQAKPDHVPAHLTYAKLLARTNAAAVFQGRQAEAEGWFLKAQTLAPNDSTVYQHYGQFLAESGRLTEAAQVYLKGAQLAPTDYEIIFNAANTLRQAGRNSEAELYYQKAVHLRPNEVLSHMNLGAMLHVNGKLAAAEQSYLAALRLRPDDPITLNNLHKLRTLLGPR